MNDLRDLYEEVILDHNRNPRNYPKRPPGCNRSAKGHNPLCGDAVEIHLTVRDGRIADIGFEGDGCAISTASASLLTEAVMGKTVEEARSLFGRLRRLLTSSSEPQGGSVEDIGKLAVLGGVKDYPMRVKCATLAWHTLIAALEGNEATTTE